MNGVLGTCLGLPRRESALLALVVQASAETPPHPLDERLIGIVILLVLALLVVVKRQATGSLVELPTGDALVRTVNIFNLLFLLAASPAAAVLLVARAWAVLDPTHVDIGRPSLLVTIQIAGLALYVVGYGLMAWALVVLGHQYQPGGNAPREGERIVVDGPYRVVRHPMYAAALSGAFGLSFLTQSWGIFAAFCAYVVLILAMVRREEAELRRAFGSQYEAYQRRVRALVPFLY